MLPSEMELPMVEEEFQRGHWSITLGHVYRRFRLILLDVDIC